MSNRNILLNMKKKFFPTMMQTWETKNRLMMNQIMIGLCLLRNALNKNFPLQSQFNWHQQIVLVKTASKMAKKNHAIKSSGRWKKWKPFTVKKLVSIINVLKTKPTRKLRKCMLNIKRKLKKKNTGIQSSPSYQQNQKL